MDQLQLQKNLIAQKHYKFVSPGAVSGDDRECVLVCYVLCVHVFVYVYATIDCAVYKVAYIVCDEV